MRRGAMIAVGVLAGAATGGGCGSTADKPPPAAEPASAPVPEAQPEGDVVRLGGEIEGLAFDAKTGTLAAATRKPGRLTLIDGESLDVEDEVAVGDGTRHLGLAEPGGPVLVPAQFEDELDIVSLPDGRVQRVNVGESPHDVAVAAGSIFVGDEGGDQLTVVDGTRLGGSIPTPDQPGAVEEVAGVIAVVSVADHVLTTYDPRSLDEVGRVDVGEGPTHAAAIGDHLFVVDTRGDQVVDLSASADAPQPEVVASADAPGTPYAIAIDGRRERLWVTSTATNEVTEFTVGGEEIERLASYPTVRQPNSVAVDERTGAVFVAGAARGEIQRFVPSPRSLDAGA